MAICVPLVPALKSYLQNHCGLRSAGWSVADMELNDDTAMSARKVQGLTAETSLLLPLSVILELFEAASHAGGTIEIIARINSDRSEC